MAIDSIGNGDKLQSLLIGGQRGSTNTGTARENQARDKAVPQSIEHADAVSLTVSATNLLAAERALAQQPAVDRSRVEHIRRQIQHGEFEIDAERVAEKMMAFEQLLDAKLGRN